MQVLGNLQMVYQFLFDVFLFNEFFSDLQLLGIGITVITFVMDIYITIKDNSNTSSPTTDDIKIENGQELNDTLLMTRVGDSKSLLSASDRSSRNLKELDIQKSKRNTYLSGGNATDSSD